MLEEFEVYLAEELGISGEDIDSVRIYLEVKNKALQDADYSLGLERLRKLHSLRHLYSRAQRNLRADLEICPSPPGAPHCVDASRFWAVLIGINEYASYPLRGCVPDAQLMEKYLTEDLGMPSDRIQLLLGSNEHKSPEDPVNPSRAHIVGALLSLLTNPGIVYGDNIIIYYSGHGSYYPHHTEEDDASEYIETICPIDRDTLGENGKPVPDISDREFNTILSLISQAKGHCITVILDCCYSSGVCRNLPESGARTSPPMARATLQDMLVAGETNLKRYPDYRSILAKDWLPETNSHVVLAACRDYQYAKAKKVIREDGAVGYIGIFTDSLVRVLRSGHCKKETTYADLVRCLDKTSHQTPVVAGTNKDVRLWYQD
ncbi:caspase domain-containing protein [Armillaria nabsnona]|nr:caspase domain-containing protein [Armillaria nabsnona]